MSKLWSRNHIKKTGDTDLPAGSQEIQECKP